MVLSWPDLESNESNSLPGTLGLEDFNPGAHAEGPIFSRCGTESFLINRLNLSIDVYISGNR